MAHVATLASAYLGGSSSYESKEDHTYPEYAANRCVWVSVEDPKRCKNYTSWSATFDQQGDVAYNQGPRPTNLSCCIGCRADQLCVPAGCRFSRGKWPSQELPYRQFSVVVFDFARRKRNQTTMAGLDGFYDFQTFFGKPMEANMHYQQGSSLQLSCCFIVGPTFRYMWCPEKVPPCFAVQFPVFLEMHMWELLINRSGVANQPETPRQSKTIWLSSMQDMKYRPSRGGRS